MTYDGGRMPGEDGGWAGATARLLLVEDDAQVADALYEFLTGEGYQVDRAGGADAVGMLAGARYNLVLTNVKLARINGLRLLEMIRRRHPEVVVLVLTSYGMMARAVQAVQMGAYEYLIRPIIDEEIRVTIQKALRQQMRCA